MKTGGNNQSLFLFIIAFAFACVSLWSTTDLLRKNDQATILAGANDWARGERQEWSRYYQFDKTYILYAYTAAVLKANHVLGEIRDPVWLGNHAVASAFWLALFVFIGRFRKTLSPLALCATLAAPAILFNTQYVNSTVLSSAFFPEFRACSKFSCKSLICNVTIALLGVPCLKSMSVRSRR